MVTEIRSWVHDVHIARAGLNVVRTSKIIKEIGWQAPSESFFKLNTDGSRLKNGLASAGELVRDCSGKWQFGFGMNIGLCSVTSAELWGLFQGLTSSCVGSRYPVLGGRGGQPMYLSTYLFHKNRA